MIIVTSNEEVVRLEQKYFDCFVDSVVYALGIFLGGDKPCTIGSVDIIKEIPKDCNLHVFIGITGDLYGTAVLSFTNEASLGLASAMCGMEIAEHNEITVSALREILNITAGGAATRLSQLGRIADVTPPTIISGSSIDIQTSFPLISASLQAGNIPFRMSASAKEKLARRIMIVDDSELIRVTARDLLTANGLDVTTLCVNGADCLMHLEKEVPDIILLDINMPGINGLDVLRMIKEKGINTKVVMLTSMGDPSTVQKAAGLGADGFVMKPFDKNLISILKNL